MAKNKEGYLFFGDWDPNAITGDTNVISAGPKDKGDKPAEVYQNLATNPFFEDAVYQQYPDLSAEEIALVLSNLANLGAR